MPTSGDTATMIGRRIGSYEIVAKLGEGGMGEVYRACEHKLDRNVAIKILPLSVAGDAAALGRFEREAKAVAALSHPNILAIHDFGRDGATVYAVMELLEGQTLRDRLDAGPLPVRKTIEIALQIAQRRRCFSHGRAHNRVHSSRRPARTWPTTQTNPGASRCTSGRFRLARDNGRCRLAADSRDGARKATSFGFGPLATS